ncbi:MAG: putative amino acid transporter substrate-binding protein, partial [Actinomycetia bacterium]|nr:putative amino acid transporter substrate-binding protein [Actinomycetes bacterium]
MRKTIVLLALVAAALAAVGTAGASRHAGTFTYCTDPTFPPMELSTTSGTITGFDVEMAAKLAATWGASAKPLKTAFPGLIPALNAKKCDAVISGIFVT